MTDVIPGFEASTGTDAKEVHALPLSGNAGLHTFLSPCDGFRTSG